jgi:tetratricopeptide (TPR) repeat protein
MKLKNLWLSGALCLSIVALQHSASTAQNVTTPRAASPAAEVSQTIGLTKITVNYSRPNVTSAQGADRTGKIWGQLVPFGMTDPGFGNGKPNPWRAGANENTVITFSDDVKIEGKDLKAGSYGLHIEVKENNDATVYFSSNTQSWGSYFYEPSEDVLKVAIKTTEHSFTQSLTYNFVDITANSSVLALDWENKRFPIKVDVAVHDLVLANMRRELRSTPGFGWQGPLGAANYCLRNNINHEEAIGWADQAIAGQKNFNTMSIKAQLLAQSGKGEESTKIIKEALALPTAVAGDYYGYGRQLIGQDKDAEALAIFTTMKKKWPDHWLSIHGMARGYSAKGDFKKALKYEREAVTKAPDASKGFLEGYIKTLEEGKDFN